MNPSIQRLAQLMQTRQEQGEPPYVLLLGSSLSLTPSVRRAFAGTEDWEPFWKEMQCKSSMERKTLLKEPLDALGLESGYQAMARLAEAGYFNIILTLNVDDAIDDAVRLLRAEHSVLLIYDGSNAAQIVKALSHPMPRIKIVKLRGDINAQALPLTVTGTFEFPDELKQSISQWLSRDTILVGDIPHDLDMQRCITQSTGALWCILPDKPASDFVKRVKQVRQFGEIITIAGAEFNAFFTALVECLRPRGFQSVAPPEPVAPVRPVHSLVIPGSSRDYQSRFYVERPGDRIALEAIKHQGVTITIKAPGQMGRSLLLRRIMDTAEGVGKRVAFLDFQLFDKAVLTDANTFFRQFCTDLTEELGMAYRVDDYWETHSGTVRRCCTRYMSHYLLKALNNPLVLAMDNVDTIFDSDFRSDFFGMLRSWHNSHSIPAWKHLDLVLVTSFESYELIDDPHLSSNIGVVIELTDFTLEQMADLNRRHDSPLSPDQEKQLMALLRGHPYLVRWALYLVASRSISAEDLFNEATDDHGPFGDHLKSQLLRLYDKHDKEELIQGLRLVVLHDICPDERTSLRLQREGLVRRERGTVLPRCQLYADYFRERLNV